MFLEVKHSANIYMYSTDHYNLLQYNINSVIMQQLPWLPFFFLLVPTFLGRILQTMFLFPIIIQNFRRCPRRMAVFNSFLKIINDWLCISHPILTFDFSTWKCWCQLQAHWRIFPLNVQFLRPSTLTSNKQGPTNSALIRKINWPINTTMNDHWLFYP